ncbi:MAG: hypothetical protein JNM55_03545 [Anaerolineales bacterium]|nr:hypothetical protein [Anaerolineales bacterium]
MNKTIIYVRLLDEGTYVVRPTYGEIVKENVVRILPTKNYDPDDEIWEFAPGAIVRCARELWDEKEILLAVEKI